MEELNSPSQTVVNNYTAPNSAKRLIASMCVALVVGIVAAGKDSVMQILLKNSEYARIVTTVTRPPRLGEIQDVSYHFIDNQTATQNLLQHKYFEAKLVHGRVYGTTIAELEKIAAQHKIALADVDVQGVDEYHAADQAQLVAVFLIPPDFTIWQERWLARGVTDANEKRVRMQSAVHELEHALSVTYYKFVVNDDLTRAAQLVNDIFHHQDYDDDAARVTAQKLHDDIVDSLGNR